jgi:hypothetical protein
LQFASVCGKVCARSAFEKGCFVMMNITGVTTTMPNMDQQFAMTGAVQAPPQAQAPPPVGQVQQADSPDAANVTVDTPVELMDTTNVVPQDPAVQQLNNEVATMTGVGQNIDMTV